MTLIVNITVVFTFIHIIGSIVNIIADIVFSKTWGFSINTLIRSLVYLPFGMILRMTRRLCNVTVQGQCFCTDVFHLFIVCSFLFLLYLWYTFWFFYCFIIFFFIYLFTLLCTGCLDPVLLRMSNTHTHTHSNSSPSFVEKGQSKWNNLSWSNISQQTPGGNIDGHGERRVSSAVIVKYLCLMCIPVFERGKRVKFFFFQGV